MPPACPVESHADRFSRTLAFTFFSRAIRYSRTLAFTFFSRAIRYFPQREPPPGKPVASQRSDARHVAQQREPTPGKPVVSNPAHPASVVLDCNRDLTVYQSSAML